jgi:tRNA uridine 5-carbamoylmethylation protein Kti12
MASLTLIRGMPGSGKTTLGQKLSLVTRSSEQIETDMFFYDQEGNYNFDPKKLHEAHEWCRKMCLVLLEKNRSVIVSNTFITVKELEPYFYLASRFNIVPNIITCQSQFENIHNVPESTLNKMKEEFEWDISSLFSKF